MTGVTAEQTATSRPPEPGMSTSSVTISFTPKLSSFFGNGAWLLAASLAAALFPGLLSMRRTTAELLRSR